MSPTLPHFWFKLMLGHEEQWDPQDGHFDPKEGITVLSDYSYEFNSLSSRTLYWFNTVDQEEGSRDLSEIEFNALESAIKRLRPFREFPDGLGLWNWNEPQESREVDDNRVQESMDIVFIVGMTAFGTSVEITYNFTYSDEQHWAYGRNDLARLLNIIDDLSMSRGGRRE